jgi:hypothetical protein
MLDEAYGADPIYASTESSWAEPRIVHGDGDSPDGHPTRCHVCQHLKLEAEI